MAVSSFDLFKIGIGPSSSHTVGPMRAAARFIERWLVEGCGAGEPGADLARTARVRAEVFGSLALTGRGHGTDKAVLMGLEGHWPNQIDPDIIPAALERIRKTKRINLFGRHEIGFDEKHDLIMNKRQKLPFHTNGMRFTAFDADGNVIATRDYYSVGGGFVVNQDEAAEDRIVADTTDLPYPFHSGDELLAQCARSGLSIAQLMMANERVWRSDEQINAGLDEIWAAMQSCVSRGIRETGTLPGGLHVSRRAPSLHAELAAKPEAAMRDPLTVLDWVNLYALAVNEENAAGGRVVTAPTNGAAGIIPAVLHYYDRFCPGANLQGVRNFLLTAAAVGILYKENASISGAEVGCQGEVGVACSMAAAGLVGALGGSASQIENAAEIGMEHNLGLTCDPIGGLVQIPCIERNAMGAVKAINAYRMAMRGDGKHKVSLDKVIKTMRDTGRDMQDKYKETSRGGLAVNVIEC
ncbi:MULTISPECIES: L-serine ammonia-lyase [Lysobacter]|uniref:L-serine dehydratase n=2 Tax=Lysobacter TaxID=68 RepID=A0A0S2DDV4_LYSEN|nr:MULTISPECIES: L-serine ammonia-lyase [Lysobacter]ALN56493.1 L-serine ammonia-lyase [Lysobacter enzymogenes]QCW25314.1 L-serine ammonia-lyase [Lysobacter enzymogenes]QQQ00187.1 L-serine ammonia-lyase [Lysobacter enzymogenes]WMT03467.1 L-serine ammonia-lyase [Lysobacter yananisis]